MLDTKNEFRFLGLRGISLSIDLEIWLHFDAKWALFCTNAQGFVGVFALCTQIWARFSSDVMSLHAEPFDWFLTEKCHQHTILFKIKHPKHNMCNKGIFDSHHSCAQKYFWKNSYKSLFRTSLLVSSFRTFCIHIGQLLEAQISKSLNFQKNLKWTTFSFENSNNIIFIHFSKTNSALNNCLICSQKVPKEA